MRSRKIFKNPKKQKNYSKKIFQLKKISEFSYISRTNSWHKIALGSLKNLWSSRTIAYYMLYSNSFYTQLASFRVPQRDSYYVHDDTEDFCLFPLQLNIDFFFGPFFTFWLFLPQGDFDVFHMLLFGVFLYAFDNSYLSFLYIYRKKNYKKYFISIFIVFKNYVNYVSILWTT